MATEKRLIDANALIAVFDERNSDTFIQYHTRENKEYWWGMNAGINWGVNTINNAPTVDAVEVVHGRWEPRTDVIGFVRCSVCHDCNIYEDWADGKKWNYCPNCGAKMDGDGDV